MAETRYVVRGKVGKDALAGQITAGTEVWLTFSREAGGWYNWARDFRGVFAFPTREKAALASTSNGPWYLAPDPPSIEILEADYEPPKPERVSIRAPQSRPVGQG